MRRDPDLSLRLISFETDFHRGTGAFQKGRHMLLLWTKDAAPTF